MQNQTTSQRAGAGLKPTPAFYPPLNPLPGGDFFFAPPERGRGCVFGRATLIAFRFLNAQRKRLRYHLFRFPFSVHVLFLICLSARLCFHGRYLDCCDSIDFALGLRDYDISLHQPHFPGYPVYLFFSWLCLKLLHREVWALMMPGILFGSLTIYPLYALAIKMFSQRVAILTAGLYILNPLCWLQAERPTSDATGMFFIIVSACFLYRVVDIHNNSSAGKGRYLFWGCLVLGLGLGVRLSYFPFAAMGIGITFYITIKRVYMNARGIFYGLFGFFIGVCLWLIPQISYVGLYSFRLNGFSFVQGHFSDWGGSVFTFSGWGRIVCLIKSITEYGLGVWWQDTSFLRLIPFSIMVISFLYPYYSIKRYRYDNRVLFFGLFIIPYMIWVVIGQNVANPRHILPVLPLVLMLIACGLNKVYTDGGKVVFLTFTVILIVSMSVVSRKEVAGYHTSIPAPVQVLRFIQGRFQNVSTRIYCSEEKRFFDYYLPRWDVRMVRSGAEIDRDLQSSLCIPENVLVIIASGEVKRFPIQQPPLKVLKGNVYTGAARETLFLYELKGL